MGQSFGVAEAGAPELMRTWSPDSFNVLRLFPADTYPLGTRTAGGSGSYGGSVFKLNRNLYFLDVTGTDNQSVGGSAAFRRRGGGGRQRIGVLARIRPLNLPMNGALTTQNATSVGGSVTIDGNDRAPNATWTSCAAPDTSKAGLNTDGSVSVSGVQATVTGSPPVRQDASIDNSTFDTFGDVTYAQLTAMAQKVYPGGASFKPEPTTVNGVCNKADPINWGDGLNRAGACGNYFPIIHIKGDGSFNNYQGQGVLLVDGNLSVAGSFQFFGVVIVKGTLNTSGGGTSPAHFFGTVLAQNQGGSTNSISGAAKVLYSKCAVVEALQWTGLGAMARSRGWVALN
jgi:hypothetical protein